MSQPGHPLVEVDLSSRSRLFHRPDGRRTLTMITPIYNERSCRQAACHAHPAGGSVLRTREVSRASSRSLREIGDGARTDDGLADRGGQIVLVVSRGVQAVAGNGELPSFFPDVSQLHEEERGGIV